MKTKSNYDSYIGKQVAKKSKKPFKSGSKVNTITGVITNTQTGNPAFTFQEDDSNVECWRCIDAIEGI